MRLAFVAIVLFLFTSAALAADPCLKCHEEKTPGIVAYWEQSAHFGKVGCAGCHGGDVEASHSRKVVVEAEACGSCHKRAYESHRLSKHAIGMKTGRGCTRNLPTSEEQKRSCLLCHEPGSTAPIVESECAMFLAQSPEMQSQGCNACHRVEVRCDSCHTRHGTDTALARSAEACGVCHMGPDHAQYEMWKSSPHGVIYGIEGEKAAPTCATCHMPEGSHDVSRGVATGIKDEAMRAKERGFMVGICSACHTSALARRNLEEADRIHDQSLAMLGEAQGIVRGLYDEGLLMPMPAERPEHPLFGHDFVIGPHMIYEDISDMEAGFFRMMMFYYMSSYKGAFHQNPDYAHWFGNAPLKLGLSELKSKAALLREVGTTRKRLDNLSEALKSGGKGGGDIKEKLRLLLERRLRGEVSEGEYQKLKDRLLDEEGL